MSDTTEVLPAYMLRVGESLDAAPEVVAARDSGRIVRTRIRVPSVSESVIGGNDKEVWLVTRYEDFRAITADHRRFSSDFHRHVPDKKLTPGLGQDEHDNLQKGNLQLIDPPEHTRLRRLLMGSFTVSRMRRLEESVAPIVQRCLDDVLAAGPGADLVELFALPIPSQMISEMLGVPHTERAAFQARAKRQLDVTLSPEESVALGREARAYMRALVARAKVSPGEDILSSLVREHLDELGETTLVNLGDLILTAGHQTTSSMLALSVYTLLREPEQLAWLRKNLDRMDTAVEELLRYVSVVTSGPPRVATEDVEIGGTLVRKGEMVVLSNLAANRDPALVPDPERLDLSRPPTSHVAFGHGAHHCLGAALARMQLRVALTALLRRFPSLALAVPPSAVGFRTETVVFGLHSLPVRW